MRSNKSYLSTLHKRNQNSERCVQTKAIVSRKYIHDGRTVYISHIKACFKFYYFMQIGNTANQLHH